MFPPSSWATCCSSPAPGPPCRTGVGLGKVGDGGLDLETARGAARLVGLHLLAAMRAELGDLDHVQRVVKVLGMVNCVRGFTSTPPVIDGCTDLFIEVFGETGRGARSAVGMAELPFGISVEIEAVVQVRL